MIKKKVLSELALGHRAYYVRCSSAGHVLAASMDGRVTVAGPNRDVVGAFSLRTRLSDLSVSPDGQMLAIAAEGAVQLLDLSGAQIRSIAAPSASVWFDGAARLWLARPSDGSTFSVEVYENIAEPRPASRIELEDPFGDSALVFPDAPLDGSVPLWVAAGQDGQALYWLESSNGGLHARRLDGFDGCLPPALAPDGNHFLLVADDELSVYSRSDLTRVRKLESPFDEDTAIEEGIYLNGASALLVSAEGILFTVDVTGDAGASEVILVGHEPRPVSELYPNVDDSALCSDVSRLVSPGNGAIVSINTVLPDPTHVQHARLVWWADG